MDLLGKSVVLWSLVLTLGAVGCDKKEDRGKAEAEAPPPPTRTPPVPDAETKDDRAQPPPAGHDEAAPPPPPLAADDPAAPDPKPDGPDDHGPGAEPEPAIGGFDESLTDAEPKKATAPDEGGDEGGDGDDEDIDWGVSFTPDQGTLILSFEADDAAHGTPKWCMDPERVLDRIETAVRDHEQCSIEKKFSLQQGGGFSYACRSAVPDKPSCTLSFAARLKIKRRSNSEVDYRIFGTADITRECTGSEAPFEPRREDIVAASTKGATGRLEEIVDLCSKRGALP